VRSWTTVGKNCLWGMVRSSALPYLKYVSSLGHTWCQYFILPWTDGSHVIFCGLYLSKECILFITIHQRRCKNNVTATFETYCHLNVACTGRQAGRVLFKEAPWRGFKIQELKIVCLHRHIQQKCCYKWLFLMLCCGEKFMNKLYLTFYYAHIS